MTTQIQKPHATGEVAQMIAKRAVALLADLSITVPTEAANIRDIALDELLADQDRAFLLAYAAQIESPGDAARTFATQMAEKAAAEFGGYGVFRIDAMCYEIGSSLNYTKFAVGAGGLEKDYSGNTVEGAFQACRAESKPAIAAKKRAEAARLLAEADKLDPKPAAEASP